MTLKEQITEVNRLLQAGEPGNVTIDEHSSYASSGYKPQAIFDAMNEVFEFGTWGFDEISSEVSQGDKGMVIAKVRVWLKGCDFKPEAWGQQKIIGGNVGDARKGGNTDAIKKAFSYLSIGNRAFLGLLGSSDKGKQNGNVPRPQQGKPQPPKAQAKPQNVVEMKPVGKPQVTETQVNALYDLGKLKGHWQGLNGMCAFASAELSFNVAKEDFLHLAAEQYQQLVQAVEQEAIGAGAGRIVAPANC